MPRVFAVECLGSRLARPPQLGMARLWIAAMVALLAIECVSAPRAASEAYQIDAAQSRVTIAIGKAGAFSFLAGHTHEVSGPIESGSLDIDPDNPSRSRVHLIIATSALEVTGANEPPDDRPKVQEAWRVTESSTSRDSRALRSRALRSARNDTKALHSTLW